MDKQGSRETPLQSAPCVRGDFPFRDSVIGMSFQDVQQLAESSDAAMDVIPGARMPLEIPGGHILEFNGAADKVELTAAGLRAMIPKASIAVYPSSGGTSVELKHHGATSELVRALLAAFYPQGD